MIPKRIQLQFQTLLHAAKANSLCLVETSDRKTGKPAYVLCAQDSANNFAPLAQLGMLSELNHPGHACTKLI